MSNKIMKLADAYADAMEKGPFSKSYQATAHDTRIDLQTEIDRVMAERDAEIERLTHSPLYMGQALKLAAMEQHLATQRRVLEQALEALQTCSKDSHRGQAYRDFSSVKVADAITAIQEVLR